MIRIYLIIWSYNLTQMKIKLKVKDIEFSLIGSGTDWLVLVFALLMAYSMYVLSTMYVF